MPGAGRQPLAHLPLHHHQHAVDGGHVVEQVEHQRGGHVVGQVGHERPGVRRAEHGVPVERQGVAFHDAHAAPARRPRRSTGSRWRSISTAVTVGPGLGQRQGERARARRRSRRRVAGADLGQPGDAPHGVGVDDEVLAQRPAGAEPVPVEQLGDLAPGEGHGCRDRHGLDSSTVDARGRVGPGGLGHRLHARRRERRPPPRRPAARRAGRLRLAAVRHRRQVRRIGLDQQPVERAQRGRRPDVVGRLERDDAAERQVGAEVEAPPRPRRRRR